MSYWDTSAIVKLFAKESDSSDFEAQAARELGRMVTSWVTRLELWSTLRRKESESGLLAGEAGTLLLDFDFGIARGEWTLVPTSAEVRAEFERVVEICCSRRPRIVIRTLDALHIASALAVSETEIVTADKRQREAAALLGFQLFPTTTP